VFNLFRAEWIKIMGNRWVTAFLILIFPVGMLAFVVVMSVLLALVPSMRADESAARLGLDRAEWTEQAIESWAVPNSLLGRLVMLGFTVVVFAGEYQWQTWKNVVPRNRRTALIVIKFLAVAVFVVLAFMLASIIFAVGWGVMVKIAGGTYGPPITRDVLADFAGDYLRQAWLAFTLTLIAASFAALAGMFTRSILGGVLVGVMFTYAEGLSILGMVLIARLVDFPRLVYLYRLTPSYNVANAQSWLTSGRPAGVQGEGTFLGNILDFSDSLNFSVAVLTLWVIGLITLTAYLFQKQDIT
jgi:ABC-type transport system involved in multi-copper enzyme maturation permease subunit